MIMKKHDYQPKKTELEEDVRIDNIPKEISETGFSASTRA